MDFEIGCVFRFVLEKFEELFSKFFKIDRFWLCYDELYLLISVNKNVYDLFGWMVEKLEWGIIYLFFKDKDGFVFKE